MRTLHAILPAAVFGCLLTAPVALAAPGDGEKTKLNLGSADEPAAQASSGPGGGSLVRTIVGLAVVLGVIYGLHWVLKQIKASKDSTASGESLETIATLPLGTNRALHLVRAGREIVLIGTAEQHDRADPPLQRGRGARAGPDRRPEDRDGRRDAREPRRPSEPKGFMDILRSKTVVK